MNETKLPDILRHHCLTCGIELTNGDIFEPDDMCLRYCCNCCPNKDRSACREIANKLLQEEEAIKEKYRKLKEELDEGNFPKYLPS